MKKAEAKSRRTAAALVTESITSNSRGKKWTELLSPEDTTYVCMVTAAMKKTPGAAPHTVAGSLKKELNLTVSVGTIAKSLKELMQ